MKLSPEILDALRNQYDAMGFGFNPKGLAKFEGEGIDLMMSLGGTPKDIAAVLAVKITAADIEHLLPRYASMALAFSYNSIASPIEMCLRF